MIINGEELEKKSKEGKIAVYIAGEVKNPGVYYIDEETRLNDLINLCGGFTDYADISDLNLAEKLNDSDKVEVPRIEESQETDDEENDGLININTASKEELQTLNGIGETLAQNIIEYRNKNKFESVEDLMNVNGIGQSKFNSVKEYICVD